jgi:plasmid stabilization system protein ParE
MPTYGVSFNLAAIQDYLDAREWYAQRSEEVAARFLESVDAAIHRIHESPESWPIVLGRYRRVSLDTFPHSLIY